MQEIAHEVLLYIQSAPVNRQNAWQSIEILEWFAIRCVTDGAVIRAVAQALYPIVNLAPRKIEAGIIKFISADKIKIG
jgi:hypothetical protein